MSTTGVRRILVPLADEPIDDATFQQVFDLAQIAGSTIRLLYVRAGRAPSAGEEASSLREMARIAARSAGVPVQRVVRFGDVDTAILREAAHWPADVVALTAGDPAWLSRAVRSGKAARAFRDDSGAPLHATHDPVCGMTCAGQKSRPALGRVTRRRGDEHARRAD